MTQDDKLELAAQLKPLSDKIDMLVAWTDLRFEQAHKLTIETIQKLAEQRIAPVELRNAGHSAQIQALEVEVRTLREQMDKLDPPFTKQ